MASGPNVHIARFVFENIWTVENLEDYVTGYYPDGVPLLTLRRALGYNRVPPHEYAHTLVRVAVALFVLGHVRQGWKKPGFLKKKKPSPVGFFVFFFGFWVFFWGFWGFLAQTRGFLGFFFQFHEYF
jgi:hypothetical protein